VSALVAGLEQHAVPEVVASDVRDRGTGRRPLPVRVEHERVLCAVEHLRSLRGVAVLGSQTVGVVVRIENRRLDVGKRLRRAGGVVDTPELLGGRVQRERPDPGVGVVRERVGHPVTAGLVLESEDEFAHVLAWGRQSITRRVGATVADPSQASAASRRSTSPAFPTNTGERSWRVSGVFASSDAVPSDEAPPKSPP